MYVIRDCFTCKPGMSRKLAEKFKAGMAAMKGLEGFREGRVMVDAVAGYWTVVIESEVESLERFEKEMAAMGTRPEFQKPLEGYMDLVIGGKREIYRIV